MLMISCKMINSSWSQEIKIFLKGFTGANISRKSIISLGKGKGRHSQAQHARALGRDMAQE